jgi:hypothetical protein
MAITQTVYSPLYPNNTKTITVDVASRVPVGAEGDEKYIIWVYAGGNVYKDNTNRIAPDPIFLYEFKRGWALSSSVSSPVNTSGGTLTVAIDEDPSGAITLTVASGNYSGASLASSLQNQINITASGTNAKASVSNSLSYLNAQVKYEDGKFMFLSGSTKSSYNDAANWGNTSSIKVTGGTLANTLGFALGYANSYDLATTSSGRLYGPASAHANVDDAIRWAVMSIANQIDYTS